MKYKADSHAKPRTECQRRKECVRLGRFAKNAGCHSNASAQHEEQRSQNPKAKSFAESTNPAFTYCAIDCACEPILGSAPLEVIGGHPRTCSKKQEKNWP